MIELIDVWKGYGAGRARRAVLAGASIAVPAGRKIALLGAPGSGKTTVIQLMTRLDAPDSGSIRSSGRICWPLSYANFVEKTATFRQNAHILGHLFGADGGEIAEIALELSGVRDAKMKTLKRYGMQERKVIALCLTLAVPFDWYFIDDALPALPPDRLGAIDNVIADRLSRASLIWATSDPGFVESYCDAGLVLHRGKLSYYDTLSEASEAYLTMTASEGSKRE